MRRARDGYSAWHLAFAPFEVRPYRNGKRFLVVNCYGTYMSAHRSEVAAKKLAAKWNTKAALLVMQKEN